MADDPDWPFPICVIQSEISGRGYCASQYVKKSETVVTCIPVAAIPTDEQRLHVCSGCFAYCTSVCSKCKAVTLCTNCAKQGTRASLLHEVCKAADVVNANNTIRMNAFRCICYIHIQNSLHKHLVHGRCVCYCEYCMCVLESTMAHYHQYVFMRFALFSMPCTYMSVTPPTYNRTV